MKNILLATAITIAVFTSSFISSAQSGVHKSALFKNASASYVGAVTNYMTFMSTSIPQLTVEAWVKLDTTLSTFDRHIPCTIVDFHSPGYPTGTSPNVLNVSVLNGNIIAKFGNVSVSSSYPADSEWHHIALVVDTVTVLVSGYYQLHDSLTIYLDGNIASTFRGYVSAPAGAGAGTMLTTGLYTNSYAGTTFNNYWQGHMSKFIIYDSVMYNAPFTPDCVFDTAMFYSHDTVSSPVDVFIPMNGIDTIYYKAPNGPQYPGTVSWAGFFVYDYLTSPCAPVYSYYAPTVVTDSAVIWAHNSNASYMKGAHAPAHVNGWTGAVTSITEGVFTDSMHVYSSGIYPYFSDYYSDTVAHKPVTVNTTTITTGVSTIQRPNIALYPNPSNGPVTIKVDEPGSITVTDISGRLIKQMYVVNSTTVSDLKRGIYIVSANDCHLKLIVQ